MKVLIWKIVFFQFIEISFPCIERHTELVLKAYVSLNREYLINTEESMTVYGIVKDVDEYIDTKLQRRLLD
jgi:hypothetical protein